jgi:hypothetical protein
MTIPAHVLHPWAARAEWISACDRYLVERTSSYQWRRARYRKAAGRLRERGLADSDTLVDVAAGLDRT